ncbi:DUF5330 domain-containing protein [Bartonella sp. WD16.2]|uniref:DUF5330 domain-containing protein n=1 Tax=Bartonella sp. WD16.2 TaxID=1933904 RepID=UPI00099B06B4|nr:DUF5330 domain-containing protein [Bartonella sp. WD16.2]AQX19410.1 hypothetical protein BWD162_002770 [Bartonella sp. WD16.2]
MIRFLIKSAFFLFVIFIVISFFSAKPKNNHSPTLEDNITVSDAIIAFKNTITDLGKFCERNVEVCKTGKSLFNPLGERARDGAKIAYEYLDSIFSNKSTIQSENTTSENDALPLTEKQIKQDYIELP